MIATPKFYPSVSQYFSSLLLCPASDFRGDNPIPLMPLSIARLPASVISPLSSRAIHLSTFSCVQWLFGRRGERRCTNLPSARRFSVQSIHPKHRASSTTSMYGMASHSGHLLRYVTTQQNFSLSWFSASHWRSSEREDRCNKFMTSIVLLLLNTYNSPPSLSPYFSTNSSFLIRELIALGLRWK